MTALCSSCQYVFFSCTDSKVNIGVTRRTWYRVENSPRKQRQQPATQVALAELIKVAHEVYESIVYKGIWAHLALMHTSTFRQVNPTSLSQWKHTSPKMFSSTESRSNVSFVIMHTYHSRYHRSAVELNNLHLFSSPFKRKNWGLFPFQHNCY